MRSSALVPFLETLFLKSKYLHKAFREHPPSFSLKHSSSSSSSSNIEREGQGKKLSSLAYCTVKSPFPNRGVPSMNGRDQELTHATMIHQARQITKAQI
jgi:hypothetical protein